MLSQVVEIKFRSIQEAKSTFSSKVEPFNFPILLAENPCASVLIFVVSLSIHSKN
jgi:hypothetical protein